MSLQCGTSLYLQFVFLYFVDDFCLVLEYLKMKSYKLFEDGVLTN